MKTHYPIYIVTKGRHENPMTANLFKRENLDFKIVVEPQEYDLYCESVGKEYVMKLPFANLGLGSYPARNHCWEDSIKNGFDRHWVFDDNISKIRRINKGRKISCNAIKAIETLEEFTDRYTNVGITGFNYTNFVVAGSSDKKPFYINTHCYSAMLMKNDMDCRWRMKYNEDVDLCLQVLDKRLCTISFNAFTVDKTSTTAKMKGGNQTELYKGNAYEMKVLKARSLEEIWPEYCSTIIRFKRPHHWVNWAKFKHGLIRRKDIDFDKLKNNKFKLEQVEEIKSKSLKKFFKETE
jgi:hypothetical protein